MLTFVTQKIREATMQDSVEIVTSSHLLNHLDSTDVLLCKEIIFADDVTLLFGNGARAINYTSSTIVNDSHNDYNIVGEVLVFTIISVVMAIYMAMWLLCNKVIPAIFRAFTYKESMERLTGIFDVNMERLLRISDFMIYISIAYTGMVLLKQHVETDMGEVYLFVAVLVIVVIYRLYNFILIRILRYISDNDVFFENLTLLNRCYSVMATVIFLPISIFLSFFEFTQFTTLAICLSIIVAIFIIHYLLTLFRYFRQENISFLEYILYLCGVELIPISFIVIFTLRNYPN